MPRKLRKRHGRAAGADTLSGCVGVGERPVLGVVVGKGCIKRPGGGVGSGGGSGAAKKVRFVLEPQVRFIASSSVVVKTRGKRKDREILPVPAAEVGGGEYRRRKRVQVGGDSAAVAGADAMVRRSMRNVVNLGVEVEQVATVQKKVEQVSVAVSNSAKAEEEEFGVAVERKWKRNNRDNATDIVVDAQIRVPRRSMRSSGLLAATPFVWSHVVEKKRRQRKAGDLKEQPCVEEQLVGVQDLGRTLNSGPVMVGTVSPIVSRSKRSRRKVQEDNEPAVQKAAKVETSVQTTRSSLVAAAVILPVALENTRGRKTEDAHYDGELPKVLEASINDAPVLSGLSDEAVQGNNSVVEETHLGRKLEKKSQPSRPATRRGRHQHFASFVEEESQEQVAVERKGLPLRRSRRNHCKVNVVLNKNTTSESNNCTRAPEEGNDMKIALPSTHNAAKDGVEDGMHNAAKDGVEDGTDNAANDSVEDGMAKEDEHLDLPQNGRAKGIYNKRAVSTELLVLVTAKCPSCSTSYALYSARALQAEKSKKKA